MLFTPPVFLLLTMTIPAPPPGVVPLTLALLFRFGWRMRLWMLRRLGAKADDG